MTPSEKKAQEEKEKIKSTKAVEEHEAVEVPDLLTAQLDQLKNVGT